MLSDRFPLALVLGTNLSSCYSIRESYRASQIHQVFAHQQLDLLARIAKGDLVYLDCQEPSKSSKSFK